jgi:hypothetical protein
MFKIISFIALIASSQAALCTVNLLPASLKPGDSFTVNQQGNGQNDGSITSDGISGRITIVDSCSFNATLTFNYNSANNSNPNFRWYGTPQNGLPFPIVEEDDLLVGNITQEDGKRAIGAFSIEDQTFQLTRTGEFIGGVDFSQFITITLFSEQYQWLVASVSLPATGVSTNKGNSNNGGSGTKTDTKTTETNGAVSMTGASALVVAFLLSLL